MKSTRCFNERFPSYIDKRRWYQNSLPSFGMHFSYMCEKDGHVFPKLPFQSRTLCLISCKVPVRKEAIVLRNAFPVPSRDITIEANISHTTRRVYILHTTYVLPAISSSSLTKFQAPDISWEPRAWFVVTKHTSRTSVFFFFCPVLIPLRWQKRKFWNFTELQNFGTSLSKSRISDPFCRTSGAQNRQLSFSFREAKQLVHPIEVSSEVPWICKEAHTRMRPAALSSLPPALILSCRPHKTRATEKLKLPSQNQEFLTHSVELPVHRTGN